MLICIGDLMNANCHIAIDERGEPRISFPDGSVLLYNGEKVTCIAEGASPGESDAEKWLNSQ
ncbi:MAG: hypothetical protein PHT11_05485 [Synergistaceae bacterium]|nr:hypothetical protein [Synergistaceae bacterium]MDD3391465.1 hypothetical protein [Synergistaceae bacterium]MDD4021180.1 hypothetical protein [Synergistaceae bacterium]MDD4612289.1 hypothetical protein [Synergistaceae bacterium]